MSWREVRIGGLRRAFRLPSSRSRREREVEAELAFHLESRITDLLQAGHDRRRAEEIARTEFGDLRASRAELVALSHGRERRDRIATSAWSVGADIRYAFRQIRRAPGIAATVIGVLAAGIAASTGAFNAVRAFTVRAAPGIPHPERLVRLLPARGSVNADDPNIRWSHDPWMIDNGMSYDAFSQLRSHDSIFAVAATWSAHRHVRIEARGEAMSTNVLAVSDGYFDLLELPMLRGVGFGHARGRDTEPRPVAVISERLWRRAFGGDPAAVGAMVTMNGIGLQVVGIAPPGFAGVDYTAAIDRPDVWVPMALRPQLFPAFTRWRMAGRWGERYHVAAARLASGVTPQQAVAVGSVILTADWRHRPSCCETNPKYINHIAYKLVLAPLAARLQGWDPTRQPPDVRALWWIAVLVLLLACANASGLLLGRSALRGPEVAVRLSLGAGRGRVVRQLLTEATLLATIAGLVGLALLAAAMRVVERRYALGVDLAPDLVTGLFTIGLAVGTVVIFGLVPALHATRQTIHDTLKTGRVHHSGRGVPWQGIFTTAQIAVSCALVAATGALVGAVQRAARVDVGIPHPERVVTVQFDKVEDRPDGWSELRNLARHRLLTIPGVTHVAWTDAFPLVGGQQPSGHDGFMVTDGDGKELQSGSIDQSRPAPWVALTEPEIFAAAGLRFLHGRPFIPDPNRTQGVITADIAEREWPGLNPIGRSYTAPTWPPFTVVGVVPRIHMTVDTVTPSPMVFITYGGAAHAAPDILVIRTASNAADLIPAIRRALIDIAPTLNPRNVRPLTVSRDAELVTLTTFSHGAVLLSAIAIVLAGIGIAAVTSFSVAQRTREIGIRIALGARAPEVIAFICRSGIPVTVIGVLLGVIAATSAVKLVTRALGGAGLADYVLLAAFALVVPVVVAAAILLPARRATRVDPLTALRAE